MSITREDLEQKFLLCSELSFKASMMALCRADASYNPEVGCLSLSIRHVDTVDFTALFSLLIPFDICDQRDVTLFDQRELFELDSAIAFLHGLIDSEIPLFDPRASQLREAA